MTRRSAAAHYRVQPIDCVDPDRMVEFIKAITSSLYAGNIDETFSDVTKGITDGNAVFFDNEIITDFSASLESLEFGSNMFYRAINLVSFSSDLSSLTSPFGMFQGCTSLVNFSSSLQSIENGSEMFQGCTMLSVSSLLNILNTLPDRTSTTSPTITIGAVNVAKLTPQQLAIATVKNWNVV